ncbi:MAG TPA: dephospho-CoA kinase, partial [Chitinophagaceae bacterium]|nr:dephospho-CoA kinase [Chitinophagaceae bacterium]
LVHPVTINDAEQWMLRQTTPYAIKEAAILFESGAQRYLDFIIGVYAPPTLRILRSMRRDQLSKEEVTARLDRQMDDAIKMKLCDSVIVNDEQQALLPQVMTLHQQLLTLADQQKV